MKKYAIVAALVEAFGLPEEINSEAPKATEEEKQETTTAPTQIPNMSCAAKHLIEGVLD